MPLYSYIPYLDPDIDEKEKRSFSGHIIDTDDELDLPTTPKLQQRNPVESFKRKVNESLKNFNNRMSDLLQDGLGGVDSICRQVKGFVCEEIGQVDVEKRARGDIFECGEEKKHNSPATGPSRDSLPPANHRKLHELGRNNANNTVFAVQKLHSNVDSDRSPSPKRTKPRSRPTSKKSDQKCSSPRLASRSFNATLKTSDTIKRSSEKIRPKKAEEAKTEPACAKKRLGQIERDYQKVVENLGMVERMMACVNERIMNQRNRGDRTSSSEKSCESPKAKKKALTVKKRSEEIEGEKKETLEEEVPKKVDEPTKTRKKADQLRPLGEKEGKKDTKRTSEEIVVEEVPKKVQKVEPTKTKKNSPRGQKLFQSKISDSLSDLDALIDHAVTELGNLASTEFDVSQGSSDASFKLCTEDAAQTLYDECNMATSSSTTLGSVQMGEDSVKFEISKSFQELKESYVQKIKLGKKGKPKKTKEEGKKNSFDRLHEEIFNDSSWNRLDPASFECTFLKDPAGGSNSSVEDLDTSKTGKVEDEPNYAVMEALMPPRMEEENEEIITITLPSDKETIRSSSRKPRNLTTDVDTEQLDDETLQITVTLKGEGDDPQTVSGSEQGDFEASRKQERSLRKQLKKKIKDKKAAKTPKSQPKEGEEEAEDTPPKATKPKLKKKPKKQEDPIITEIKKIESNFDVSSPSTSSSFEDATSWTREILNADQRVKPIDPMKQVSIQCKKLIGDLVVEPDDNFSLRMVMDGSFNAPLIRSLLGRPRRPRSVRVHTPIQDPDLRSVVPEVHRKKAVSDLHERMEYQIRQTDSFDGFLNLMDKTRRKTLIRQAEKQDHNLRCHMKTSLRKRYPFRVVTASVPAGYERSKEKKDPEKKYINSLWFSPKDFKLRRNSRIFNRKRMEMYCQSMHKGPMVPKCKCLEVGSREGKKIEKASNYSIMVRSGTPLGRRPNTPRRWIQLRPPTGCQNLQRPRLHHCDILDDLTLKDLAPFHAEYPRNDDKHGSTDTLEGSFLYRLACGGHKGDADGTLMELVAPQQNDSKTCRRTFQKKPKKAATKTNDLQNLTPKAAAQLLIQNIGEIRSKKSLAKHKSKRKTSRKTPDDSKTTLHQRLEENLVKKIFYEQRFDLVPKSTPPQRMGPFKGVDPFQRVLKVAEIVPKRPPGRRSNVAKLFPYINDPNHNVFQDVTVLPVEVFYDFEPPKEVGKTVKLSLSESDELEVSTVDRPRPSTAGERKKVVGRRRNGTPKSPPFGSREIEASKPSRIAQRRYRARRSSSVGKSTGSDNPASQCSTNPNPWKPASRRPRTPRTPPLPVRKRSKELPDPKDQPQMQTLVNKEKRIRFEVNPKKTFYDVEHVAKGKRIQPTSKPRPQSPCRRAMVDHLHTLRNRNAKIEGNIQKAISIIEEKMVDVLSTDDRNYKRRTIDRMEREINEVLKMINEQGGSSSLQKAQEVERVSSKALITPVEGIKMPKPPRKRAVSKVLRFQSRPSTVEEERSLDLAEEPELSRISDEEGKHIERLELYPSPTAGEEGEPPLCPVLRCSTPPSYTDLSQKTKRVLRKISREAFGKFADVVKTKTRLIIDMTERIDLDDTHLLPDPKITSAILARSKLPAITTIHQPRGDLMSTTVSSIVSVHRSPLQSVADVLSAATTEISCCAERSITSFSDSEGCAWRKFEQSQPMELGCSACSLKRKISHDLTPFMKALNNLKAGRLFEQRHQLLPIEETHPNFRKLMGFLEGLSKVKETFDRSTMREVQLMWNPEKRCSFHSSIAGSTKLRFRKNTKAISEHSIVQSPSCSFSDLVSYSKIPENPSEAKISTGDTKNEDSNEVKAEYQSKPKIQDYRDVKLVFSEVQLVSISNVEKPIKKHKKKSVASLDCKGPMEILKDDRYSNFLRFFYLIFYTMVYFCMTAMNFSC